MRVGGIIGADLMVRRDCFDRVGNFNENIFMYGEETDFTYRVTHETNYTVVSVPDAHMTHLEGAVYLKTIHSTSGRKPLS